MQTPPLDVVLSIDTTGSMAPCITAVRRKAVEMCERLFSQIPGLRIGLIAHGDYCDAGDAYVIKTLPFTQNRDVIFTFISTVSPTYGGDAPECYEYALYKASEFSWRPDANRALVMIGDDVPHPPDYYLNHLHLDWLVELRKLKRMGVRIYGVQALNRREANWFWQEISRASRGFHLRLDQFTDLTNTLMAICYQQANMDLLHRFEGDLLSAGRMTRQLDVTFANLSGRIWPSEPFEAPTRLEIVESGRFQILPVDAYISIRDFVTENGLIFRTGRGFYELTKRETIQAGKEIVLRLNATGDLFTGDAARDILGLPNGAPFTGRLIVPSQYTAFVQSTSYNRKLIAGTEFLYEVDRSR